MKAQKKKFDVYDLDLKRGMKLRIQGETKGFDKKKLVWLYGPPKDVTVTSVKGRSDFEVIRVQDGKFSWRIERSSILEVLK